MFRIAEWQLALISIGYISLLFLLAFIGEKRRMSFSHRTRRWIYALSLAVYCSSWSFLGTSAQAAQHPLAHLPIYLGPILLFTLGWPFILRLIRVSHRLHLTSIADLIAARFGKSQPLAVAVTLVAVIGTMPYIALQIKAIVESWATIAPLSISNNSAALLTVTILAVFTMIFGIRNISVTERHPGLMLAIGFESLLKLGAFLLIGLLAVTLLTSEPALNSDKFDWIQHLKQTDYVGYLPSFLGSFAIVCAAFLCLPRQFHVMVVENRTIKDTPLSRWVFPLYLLVFATMAIPIGLAGHALIGTAAASDSYVLLLPSLYGGDTLTVLAFLGGFSAASSMAIVSAIALSTMISNEVLLPMMFNRANSNRKETFSLFQTRLLFLRRTLILAVLMLGYACYHFAPAQTLAAMGEIAFGALAQIAPALIAAFYWRKATRHGVMLGLLVGFGCWLMNVAIPALGLGTMSPWFAQSDISPLTSATLFSLCINVLAMIVGSWMTRPNVIERIQLESFQERSNLNVSELSLRYQVSLREMQALSARFVGERRAAEAFNQLTERYHRYPIQKLTQDKLMSFTEHLLASVMGTSSARLILSSALDGREMMLKDVAQFVEHASTERLQFSQALLQSALENTMEGISVIDANLRLVAWNQRYQDLFGYPDALMQVGTPVSELIRFNAERDLCGPGDIEQHIDKRIAHLRRGTPHTSERKHPDGKVIQIQGNPMPDGGFVMTFSDITAFRQAEELLKRSNIELKQSVSERSQALAMANQELEQARQRAEQAHRNKTRYMFACSHDLMQPLEAARLFSSALQQQVGPDKQADLLSKLDGALRSASELLVDLSEVAKLESGRIKAHIKPTAVNELFSSLNDEFEAMSGEYDVCFSAVSSVRWINTDIRLLRRILQNLLTNAFRYSQGGKVLLGVRRQGSNISLQVWDTGPGIPESMQQLIFEPFTRGHQVDTGSIPGLGLGLSIAKGLSEILGHRIELRSWPQHGSCFSIGVECIDAPSLPTSAAAPIGQRSHQLRVLCVDNEPSVLQAITELLSSWGHQVYAADGTKQALEICRQNNIDAMVVDYQLDHGEVGLDLMQKVRQQLDRSLPGILVTADPHEHIRQDADTLGYHFMRKPIKPASLRALLQSLEHHLA